MSIEQGLSFDHEFTLQELLTGVNVDKLLQALTHNLESSVRILNVKKQCLFEAQLNATESTGTVNKTALYGELEPIGFIEACATPDSLQSAAQLIQLILYSNSRYLMASDIHIKTQRDDFEELQRRHAALEISETKYKQLAESLDVRVKQQIKTIESAQLKLYESEKLASVGRLAAGVAHEINNPLTPIEMMVSNLSRVYLNADPKSFKENLNETTSVVSEEVYKLKEMVSHFSQFAKLPEPVLKEANIAEYCERFITQHQNGWPVVKFRVLTENDVKNINVKIDHLLINQCLINIINNAVQANPTKDTLQISMSLKCENSAEISMVLFNDGVKIDNKTQKHIFKMHYSSKKSAENMGLGLAIVKKILLDHNGDIICLPLDKGAAFKINLPISERLND